MSAPVAMRVKLKNSKIWWSAVDRPVLPVVQLVAALLSQGARSAVHSSDRGVSQPSGA